LYFGSNGNSTSNQRLDWNRSTSQQKLDVIVGAFQGMVASGADRFNMRSHVDNFPSMSILERHRVYLTLGRERVPVFFEVFGHRHPLMSINVQLGGPVTLNNHAFNLKWNQRVWMNGEFNMIHIQRYTEGRGHPASLIIFHIHSHHFDLFWNHLFNR